MSQLSRDEYTARAMLMGGTYYPHAHVIRVFRHDGAHIGMGVYAYLDPDTMEEFYSQSEVKTDNPTWGNARVLSRQRSYPEG